MTYKLQIAAIIAAFVVAFSFVAVANGAVSFIYDTNTRSYQTFNFFTATTTSATSTSNAGGYFVIAGAKRVDFYFTHGGVATTSTGTSTFTVQVTPDGVNWYNFVKLLSNSPNTNAQTLARASSTQIVGATSTVINSMDLTSDAFYGVRCIVAEANSPFTDGEHTCTGAAEY